MKNLARIFVVLCALQGVAFAQKLGPPSGGPPSGAAGGSLSGTYPNPGLASTITAGGPTGSATVAPIVTYNAAGQLTAVSSATITPGISSVTGLGTGIATALGVSTGSAGAPILFNGAGGTPSSLVGTNISGTGAGFTAGTVTTNANLTGDVTSSGNAATLATTQSAVHTWSAAQTVSVNGAASVSPSIWTGTVLTGGTATTNFPAMLVQPTGTTAVTTWSTSGTGLGMNLASGFAGNFLDFHKGGASSVFYIDNNGNLHTVGGGVFSDGGNIQVPSTGTYIFSGRAQITSPASGSIQLGAGDAAVAVAQTLRVQSVVAGTAAANGANWTLIGSLPTGTGTSGDIIIQTGVKTGSGTTQGTATTALTIKGETQAAIFANTISATLTNVATTSALCYNTGTGLMTYDGTIGTCTVSDERLKNMGERIPNALDRLLQINGVYYTWKDASLGSGRQIGVGAQTVEKVFPELVQTDSNGRKSADYQRLTAPIIEALRELKADNDNLRKKMAELKRAMR